MWQAVSHLCTIGKTESAAEWGLGQVERLPVGRRLPTLEEFGSAGPARWRLTGFGRAKKAARRGAEWMKYSTFVRFGEVVDWAAGQTGAVNLYRW